MKAKVLALGVCVLGLAGCEGAREAVPTAPAAGEASQGSMAALVGPAAPRDPAAAEALARALAGGLGDARVRRTVHQAWRNSQVSAHKLVLQEFVGTPEGRLLVEAAARSSGTSVGGSAR